MHPSGQVLVLAMTSEPGPRQGLVTLILLRTARLLPPRSKMASHGRICPRSARVRTTAYGHISPSVLP
jgi:hypothetical protein